MASLSATSAASTFGHGLGLHAPHLGHLVEQLAELRVLLSFTPEGPAEHRDEAVGARSPETTSQRW